MDGRRAEQKGSFREDDGKIPRGLQTRKFVGREGEGGNRKVGVKPRGMLHRNLMGDEVEREDRGRGRLVANNMQNRARKYAHHCDKIVQNSISFMIIACYHMILPN